MARAKRVAKPKEVSHASGRSKTGLTRRQPAERLSPQEQFCRLIAIDDLLPLAAYIKAFKWTGAPADARKTAFSLLRTPEIEERIEQLRPALVEGVKPDEALTLGQHLQELYVLERMAIAHGQIGAAIQAAVYRGKASGLYVEKVAVAHMTLEDLIAHSRKDGKIGVTGTEVKPIGNGNSKAGGRYATPPRRIEGAEVIRWSR